MNNVSLKSIKYESIKAIFSAVVILVRLALNCVHSILPVGGIIQLIIDFLVFFTVIFAIGHFLPTTNSYIVDMIFTIIFDILYFAVLIFLLKSNSSQQDDN